MFSLTFFASCLLALSSLNAVSAAPLQRRQTATTSAALSQATTLMEITTSQGPNGPLTQTCVITLTPIDNGSEVQEVKNCTVAENAASDGSSSADAGSSATTAATASATTDAASSSVTSNAAISVNGVSSTTSLTPSTQTASDSASSAAATDSSSSSASSASDSASSATATGSSSASSGAATGANNAGASSTSSSGVTGAAATAAEDNASEATATAALSNDLVATSYAVPGRALEVFPIGLGVFCGLTFIALVVVALVTFERMRYRKAFRQRKLAEQGPKMGYS